MPDWIEVPLEKQEGSGVRINGGEHQVDLVIRNLTQHSELHPYHSLDLEVHGLHLEVVELAGSPHPVWLHHDIYVHLTTLAEGNTLTVFYRNHIGHEYI